MTGVGRSDARAKIRSRGEVSVPQRVLAVGEVDARLRIRCIDAVGFQGFKEGHLDVEIVLVESIVNHAGAELGHIRFGDDSPHITKFGRAAESHAHHLP